MEKSSAASVEAVAASASRKSRVPSPMTSRPGRNFRTSGFGVGSVWMNMGQMWRVRGRSASSREIGDLVVGEVAGHQSDGNLTRAPGDAVLGKRGDQGARAA